MAVTGRAREAFMRQQRAVSLYRQLSGGIRGSRRPMCGESRISSGRSTSGSDRWRPGPDHGRPTGPSRRPRPARCQPTTCAAGRPTTLCWAKSRLCGWNTRSGFPCSLRRNGSEV